ncbi:SDR family NAD(P)-dependent oxidoreductase [Auraticoccus sp. F435]|uniref:SDR family NAD(P)-dependent oxidoreductase n=1 Tax=Auraticoccus cholistanensis TaxID=2656650 RepID=A0A6A9V1W5_9ACTN|nr:SDR family NAD(P)-dependent oxidoreductase [Auraticoccus cholistanensis]MVA77581.1 SDR family NAD(P)-dependent oxidoreductase [Auraticoccus cholistanensis]
MAENSIGIDVQAVKTAEQAENGLALVTGASSGIGLGLARHFVQNGFDVVVVAEDPALEAAADALRVSGRQVTAVHADLSRPEGVEELWARLAEGGRPLAAAALNAGVAVGGTFADTPLERHLEVVDLNVRSTVHLAKLVVDQMVATGSGRILITSSIAATAPGPYHATYAASKAFAHSFAEAIRHELKDTGVTVTSLMPGPTDTQFFDRADMTDTAIAQGPKDDPQEVAEAGFEALMAGKPHVVPGLRNRVMSEAATHLPDRLATPGMGMQTKPRGDDPAE